MYLQLTSREPSADAAALCNDALGAAAETPKAKALRLYQEGLTAKQAGSHVGRSPAWVLAALREAGIQPRRRGTGLTAACNETFFDTWSPAMAWVLGNVWARGCLTWRGGMLNLGFSSTSEDVVRKTAAHLQYTGLIASRVAKNNPATATPKPRFSWEIRRAALIEAVQGHGLSLRKTSTKPFPDVPDEYLSHFMRGYCESGASFVLGKNGTRAAVTIQSSSLTFMQGLVERMHRAGFGNGATGEPLSIWHHQAQMLGKPGVMMHQVRFTRVDLLPWLYQGADDSMWMDRRMAFYRQYVDNRLQACLAAPQTVAQPASQDF